MREREIERWLCCKIEDLGGLAYKFSSPGNNGVPDRIFIMPGGRVWFVELKTKCGRLAPLQEWQQNQIKKRGAQVRTVHGKAEAEQLIRDIEREKEVNKNAIQAP